MAALLYSHQSGGGGGGGGGSGGEGGGGGVGTGKGSGQASPAQSSNVAPSAPPTPATPQQQEVLPKQRFITANTAPRATSNSQTSTPQAPPTAVDGGSGGGAGTGKGSGTGSGTGGGSGSGSGGGAGSGTGTGTAEFMDMEAKGDSFVYVVDRSGSMSGEPLDLVRNEMIKSINALTRTQKFFAFFYDDSEQAMTPPPGEPARQMVFAIKKNREHCTQWAQTITAGGGTQPESALLEAVRMRPAAVFLLSDGGFSIPPNLLPQLKSAGIPVHTIAFRNRSGERVLKTISEATGGRYRFSP